jgi:hypothetical protein
MSFLKLDALPQIRLERLKSASSYFDIYGRASVLRSHAHITFIIAHVHDVIYESTSITIKMAWLNYTYISYNDIS